MEWFPVQPRRNYPEAGKLQGRAGGRSARSGNTRGICRGLYPSLQAARRQNPPLRHGRQPKAAGLSDGSRCGRRLAGSAPPALQRPRGASGGRGRRRVHSPMASGRCFGPLTMAGQDALDSGRQKRG